MEEAVAEIEDFMQTVRITWHECVSIPRNCDAQQELGQVFKGEQLDFTVGRVERKLAEGLESRSPLDSKNDQYIIENVELANPVAKTAIVTYCALDGFIVVDPGAAPDGTDLIINDVVEVTRREGRLSRADDEGWRMFTSIDIERFANGEGCVE